MSEIFDKWEYVDCNECQNYWNNTCDGVRNTRESLCTAFIATRSTDIPEQIKTLKMAVKSLRTDVIMLGIAVTICSICIIFGG